MNRLARELRKKRAILLSRIPFSSLRFRITSGFCAEYMQDCHAKCSIKLNESVKNEHIAAWHGLHIKIDHKLWQTIDIIVMGKTMLHLVFMRCKSMGYLFTV